MQSKPTFIIVHGAWHQPSHFDSFAAELRSLGYGVEVPSLPSDTLKSDPGDVMAQDAAAVASTITKITDEGRDVIVLCHSYGGVPTGDAVATVCSKHQLQTATPGRGRILRLIYLAAIVVPQGESLASMTNPTGASSPVLETSAEGMMKHLDPIPYLYNTTDKALAEDAVSKLVPIPISAFLGQTQYCGWKDYGLPVTYISCSKDASLSQATWQKFQDMLVEGGVKVEARSIESDHSPWLSKSKELIEILEGNVEM